MSNLKGTMNDQNLNQSHKKFAVELFNLTWDLLEKKDRSPEETAAMIHACHASCYHWSIVGQPVHLARGEWLIARVYAVLNRAEPCLFHADRCYRITIDNNLKDFDLAFAYEAMARACDLAGDAVEKAKYITLAKDAGSAIQDEEDRAYFFGELHSLLPGN